MSSRVYALANQKGGVGKTTTAINMAACVAEAGTRVLLIDMDPQANATTGLGFRPDQLEGSTYDLLHGRPLDSVIVETAVPNLFVASMFQVFPHDRGQNYSIELAERLVAVLERQAPGVATSLGITGAAA